MKEFLFKIRGYTPVVFIIIALVWAEYNPIVLVSGALLSITGELLRIRSIQFAGGSTRTREVGASELITSGPYGLIRNPLYVANLVMYTGFALGSSALFPYFVLLSIAFFCFQYGMIISLEENTLINLFGDEYLDYCKRIPRFIPIFPFHLNKSEPRHDLKEALRSEKRSLQGIAIVWLMLILRLSFLS